MKLLKLLYWFISKRFHWYQIQVVFLGKDGREFARVDRKICFIVKDDILDNRKIGEALGKTLNISSDKDYHGCKLTYFIVSYIGYLKN